MDNVFDLVVFLGNPGDQYARTRHNAARMLLEYIPGINTLSWKDKFHGRIAEYGGGASRTRFLIPKTYMNISGKSVAAAMSFFKFKMKRILIVHDEVELPFGCLAWRRGGGMGGHNGLKSIRDSIGSSDFPG
jgi:PTH1 family peptidyl-tRNA hydrolase